MKSNLHFAQFFGFIFGTLFRPSRSSVRNVGKPHLGHLKIAINDPMYNTSGATESSGFIDINDIVAKKATIATGQRHNSVVKNIIMDTQILWLTFQL